MDLQSPIFKQGYGMVPQSVMRDKRLSIEAKAIYAYLCTFADTSGECFPSAEIMFAELGITAQRFFKYRKELVEAGLVAVQKIRGNTGRYEKTVYTLSPCAENPHMENPHMENPHMENPHVDYPHVENRQYNNTSINNTSINNTSINNTSVEHSPHTPQRGQEKKPKKTRSKKGCLLNAAGEAVPSADNRPEDFEQWYSAYPFKRAREAAVTAWERAIKEKRLPSLEVLLAAIEWQTPANNWGRHNNYTPHPGSYLGGNRWQDEKPAPRPAPNQARPAFQSGGYVPFTNKAMELIDVHNANQQVIQEVLADLRAEEEQKKQKALGGQ